MMHDLTPGLPQALEKPLKGYIGIDPTAPSLHIGHLATLMLIVHLHRAGHEPIVVLGGATGMIGDPSFKSQERPFLDEEQLCHHQECIAQQIKKLFASFGLENPLILNNSSWYKELNLLSFLRQVGKHISLNYMMAKEAVKSRLSQGISYSEFAYPLLQAYDFYHLHTKHGVVLQMGGADQWGNLTTGIELIRKKKGKAAYALTAPLMTKGDGTKFGKTEGGNVWLDRAKTSAYHFYQYWLNCSDGEAPIWLKRMTLHGVDEIEEWRAAHARAPHKRMLQKKLAATLTRQVHSREVCEEVIHASEILFGEAPLEAFEDLDTSLVGDIFSHIPRVSLTAEAFEGVDSLVELLTAATDHAIFSSKREVREVIRAGGLRINKVRYVEPGVLPPLAWLQRRYLLVQRGKKHYYLIQRI